MGRNRRSICGKQHRKKQRDAKRNKRQTILLGEPGTSQPQPHHALYQLETDSDSGSENEDGHAEPNGQPGPSVTRSHDAPRIPILAENVDGQELDADADPQPQLETVEPGTSQPQPHHALYQLETDSGSENEDGQPGPSVTRSHDAPRMAENVDGQELDADADPQPQLETVDLPPNQNLNEPQAPRRTSQRLADRLEREVAVREQEDEVANGGHVQQRFPGRHFPPDIDRYSIGRLHTIRNICQYCSAYRFEGETLNCCHKGKVDLPPLHPYPEEMKPLFYRDNATSRNFFENIRKYNSAMAFASFGAKMATLPGTGPYCFKIHGQVYHRTGTLHPRDDETPIYSQLYIIEGDQAVEARLNNRQNSDCRPDVMRLLTVILNQVSPYAAAYKHMKQVEEEQAVQARASNTAPPVVTMVLKRGQDRRRYNEPTHDEVAAVFVGQDGEPPEGRDITVYPREQPPKDMSHMSSNIDPMVYPLLFPLGDMGWCAGIQHHQARQTRKHNTVTPLQFYSHRLAEREGFSPLFRGGKLLQQFIVDCYVRVEAHRLFYIKQHQADFRVEKYQGLMDHLQSEAEQQGKTPGKIVILPSQFQGSPRCMQQSYQDAMAIVAKYGRPDLFVTFTCNPRCKDILDSLLPGQKPQDRPDIITRVFHLQLSELLDDIRKKHVLGVPIAFVYVIEFQKRGLPHAHILLILADDSKLRLPRDIDSLISAEIPDPDVDHDLYETISKSMVHGPCGVINRSSVCMVDGQCSKDYPKQFRDETLLPEDGYPLYQRREDGRKIQVGRYEVNNRWIVPYNPFLSKKYNAHINVEACTSIKSVKYLFKYVYKGHDCANLEMTATNMLNHDEVSTFLDARYVSAPEGFWRLSEFKMHEHSHTVVRLAVHMPEMQPVYFREGHHDEAVQRAANQDTTLTAFFKYNEEHHTEYNYNEFPVHFVWENSQKKWKPRQRGQKNIIARMYTVSPKDMEKYCLRLLLLHTPGPTSYEDLRTIEDHAYDSFKEACVVRNLLADDQEWDNALEEAAVHLMPVKLRHLFAVICIHCEPTDPLHLWEKYKALMIEDFLHHDGVLPVVAENRALISIEEILTKNGMSCQGLGLPEPVLIPFQQAEPHFNFQAEEEQLAICMEKLNNEQRMIMDLILADVEEMRQGVAPKARAYFLDGPGGSGKTMVYNTLISYCKVNFVQVASCAWTGIASTLLTGGRTCHNLFKLPVPIVETSVCHVTPTSTHGEYLRNTTLFIVDEASMVPCHALTAIDRMLRDICGNDMPFAGKIVVLGGDFRQVLPVVPRGSRTRIVENCIKSCPLWRHFNVQKLVRNMRADEDQQEFARWLVELGNGNLTVDDRDAPSGSVEVPQQCNIVNDDIIDHVFPDLSDIAKVSSSVILTPTNEASLRVNDMVIKKVDGASVEYLSADRVLCDDEQEVNNYPVEFLNSITPSGMPPHKLLLKSGAIIMLLRNLDIKKGLCNGTRLVVHEVQRFIIDAEILTGSCKGERIFIPRIKLAPSDTNLPFVLERRQFPLRLSYSMTINKSQGQTFDKVGIYLPAPVFSHGQLYVAFSRARSFKSVFVNVQQTDMQGRLPRKCITQNVVFKEVL